MDNCRVYEFVYFVVDGICEGEWGFKAPLIVLLTAVIILNSYCLITEGHSHHMLTIARSFTFIEVIAATIDASDTIRHLEEESNEKYANEEEYHTIQVE